ncbi:MAG: hypothetical protein U1E13_08520 [Methylophilaceae bacterium]|nr:hypothetical protein [Methylophilaceae bacterium]
MSAAFKMQFLISFTRNPLGLIAGVFILILFYFHHLALNDVHDLCWAFNDYKNGYPDIKRDMESFGNFSVGQSLAESAAEQEVIDSGSLEGKDIVWKRAAQSQFEEVCYRRGFY